MSGFRPSCGLQPGTQVETPFWELFGLVGGLASVIGVIIAVAKEAGAIVATVSGFTLAGMGLIPLAGVAGAAAVWLVTGYMLYKRCAPLEGAVRCWAGVVNAITESFDSGWDVLFPSGAMHPRVDVVVKPIYWDLVQQNAIWVHCSAAPAGLGSPLIQTFYKSKAVCAAGVGALVGSGLAVAGAVAAAIAIGAIGCATIILCVFALLLALIIGAVAAIAAAAAGGAIGRAIAGDDSPTASGGGEIRVGQLITVGGKLVTMKEFDGANIGWWGHGTTVHGDAPGAPDFSDADAALLTNDACPPRGNIAGGGGGGGGTGDTDPMPDPPR